MMEAALSFVMGVVYTVITGGLLFWLTWIVCHRWLDWGAGPVSAGLIAVGVYLVVATFSAWRGVNPLAAIEYDEAYRGDSKAGLSMATGLPIVDRHGIAAAGAALIAGPANVLEAIGDVRRRLPTDRTTLDTASMILERARNELRLTDELNRRSLAVLHRLQLIKVRVVGNAMVIMPTMKGLDVVNAN
jgi:hypothetical protein